MLFSNEPSLTTTSLKNEYEQDFASAALWCREVKKLLQKQADIR
jgi:hypothetical protein